MQISTWMKGAMGCAMSHMIPWLQLANDNLAKSYLILEDDVVLDPRCKRMWLDACADKCIPNDYDIIYLGGILPPNKAVFDSMGLSMINKWFGKIKANTFFGQSTPTTYFHVCACSYVLSKTGAQKLLKIIEKKQGCFAHLDHVMCSSMEELNIYFFQPLLAHAKQDSDPTYANSEFNNLTKVEGYDSDIRDGSLFTKEEIERVFDPKEPLDIIQAITDARNSFIPSKPSRRVLHFGLDTYGEAEWITYLLKEKNIKYECVKSLEQYPLPDDTPIVWYTLGNSFQLTNILKKWSAAGKKFYLIHTGDAGLLDPIEVYSLSGCVGIIRNYIRSNLGNPNILTIPLGYYYNHSKEVTKDLVWSFMGTDWHNRKELLNHFLQLPSPHHVHFVDDWSSPKKLSASEMFSYLNRSMFVPCPSGENSESFRVYEALEAGAMPVLVHDSTNGDFIDFLTKEIPLKICNSWEDAALIVYALSNTMVKYTEYKRSILQAWASYKKKLTTSIAEFLKV